MYHPLSNEVAKFIPTEKQAPGNKCLRCYGCCITTREDIAWPQFYKDFELPQRWLLLQMQDPIVHICPFLAADKDNQPSCLIYDNRPDRALRKVEIESTNA